MAKHVKKMLNLSLKGLSVAEIARRVELNPTTVRYHLWRADEEVGGRRPARKAKKARASK